MFSLKLCFDRSLYVTKNNLNMQGDMQNFKKLSSEK